MVNGSPFVFPQQPTGFVAPFTDQQFQGVSAPQFSRDISFSVPTTASSSFIYPSPPGVITQPPVFLPPGSGSPPQVIIQPVYIPYNPNGGPIPGQPFPPGGGFPGFPPLPPGGGFPGFPTQPPFQPGFDPILIQTLMNQLSQLLQQGGVGGFPGAPVQPGFPPFPPVQPSLEPPGGGFNPAPLEKFAQVLPAFLLIMKLLDRLIERRGGDTGGSIRPVAAQGPQAKDPNDPGVRIQEQPARNEAPAAGGGAVASY